jgi:hypothetical protein
MAKRHGNPVLQTMRNLMAKGFTDQQMLVNAGADTLGGGPEAVAFAQRVWDQHFKVFNPS